MKNPSHATARAFALLAALAASSTALAETITFQALQHFTSIDGGEVPYYTEADRGSGTLAINAAVEEYRDKFARATTVYTGEGGTYDVTLTTLGELDGDCEYRFLVNGVIAGTAVNDAVTVDYTVQQHTFPDIQIPAGATLSVESNAISNGLIPEGDIFAFARGRWQTLTLHNDSPSTQPLDLQLNLAINSTNATVGDSFNLTVEATNSNSDATATQPVVSLTIPPSVTMNSSECTQDGNVLTCALAEIAPLQTQLITIGGVANSAAQIIVEASLDADQTDNNTANNTATTTLTIADVVAEPTVITVDLQLDIAANTDTQSDAIVIGESVTYTLSVTNANAENVATSPTIGVVLPEILRFQSSADCTEDGNTVLCSLSELAPGASSSVEFTATGAKAGEATLIASVNSTEPDDAVDDNESLITATVIETSPASSPEINSGGSAGGGGTSLFILLLLVARFLVRPETARE